MSRVPLNEDLLRGATAIAQHMFGEESESARRRVYHAAEKQGLPVFRLGAIICARKTKIEAWIEAQEQASSAKVAA